MADVKVTITQEYHGDDATKRFKRDMEAMKKETEGFNKQGMGFKETLGQMWEGMKTFTAAAGVAAVSLKLLYDQAKEGAAIELAKDRFDKLAASIGTTAEALDNQLDAATSGMMSQAERMASASEIISLGLADNQDDVVRLATLVSELGWNMQQVILTFANNSKMRLDALGLSVTDVETRMAALEAQGYSTDKAFDMAVIEAGEAKLQLLGSAADSTAGDFKRLEANAKDLADAFKTALVPVVGEAAAALNILISGGDDIQALFRKHEQEVRATASSYAEYINEMNRAGEAGRELIMTQEEYNRQVAASNLTDVQRAHTLIVVSEAVFNAQKYQEQETKRLMEATRAATATDEAHVTTMWEVAQAYYVANTALAEEQKAIEEADKATKLFTERTKVLMLRQRELIEAARDAKPAVDELMNALDQDISSPLTGFINDLKFFMASGGQDFQAAFMAIKEALAQNQITPEEAQTFSGELLASIEKVKVAMGEVTNWEAAKNLAETLNIPLQDALKLLKEIGTAEDVVFGINHEISLDTSGVESAYAMLMEMEGAVNHIDGTHEVTFNVHTNGSVPSYSASGGGHQGQGGTDAVGFANGADFVVPPGYPNDSYGPLYVQSGEHVQVTPAGQTSPGQASMGQTIVQIFLDSAQIAAAVEIRQGQNYRQRANRSYRP